MVFGFCAKCARPTMTVFQAFGGYQTRAGYGVLLGFVAAPICFDLKNLKYWLGPVAWDLTRCQSAQDQSVGMESSLVIIPVLNEVSYLGPLLNNLRAADPLIPVWIVDGGSTDGSVQRARLMCMKDPHLNLLINENRSQAHGVNMAAQCAYRQGYRYMIRMDAHAEYIHGFSTQLLRVLCDKNADSVTVPLIAMSQQVSGWQAANAKLQRSRLGHGNAAHRQNTGSGWVQHGHHAAFRLVCFQALGGYDTRLEACEDVDYDRRLIAAGGRIWQAGQLAVHYYPRAAPLGVWAQMWRNGKARAALWHKDKQWPQIRQVLPLGAALGLCMVPFSPLVPELALPAGLYLGTLCLATLFIGPRAALLAFVSHMGFGLGLLFGIFSIRAASAKARHT